jgi:NAD(P)-dependent dehydrogenase (short-subunit alcohol dehydrogenase family)
MRGSRIRELIYAYRIASTLRHERTSGTKGGYLMSKCILIIGGAGGVGSAVVDILASRAYTVATTVLDAAEADSIHSRYEGAVKAHTVDLSNATLALTKIKLLVDVLPALDAVVVCAASSPLGPMELTSLSTYIKAFEINCVSAVCVYQATLPALRKTRGRIVLLSSMGGRAAFPFLSPYIATKFALEGLGDVMRREAGPQGVKVSLIEPGAIRTNMVRQQIRDVQTAYGALGGEDRERYGYLYNGFLKMAGDSLRETAATPQEIAAVVVQALDALEPESRYVAGADAKAFFEMTRAMSDREVDEIFRQMFQT